MSAGEELSAYATQINSWPSFADTHSIRRKELSASVRKGIKLKEAYLERRCRKIWLHQNRRDEWHIFAFFCKGRKDKIIVTLAAWVPGVGFLPQS